MSEAQGIRGKITGQRDTRWTLGLKGILALAATVVVTGCLGPEEDGTSRVIKAEQAAATNNGATDIGPRPGAAGAGAPATPQPVDPDNAANLSAAAAACFPGLSPTMLRVCEKAVVRFQEVDSVKGTFGAATGVGLGPTFNANGCAVCHSQPAVMGAGVAPSSPQFPGVLNPQVALATLAGARNTLPSFITAAGPIREARFKSDGGVHGLFTIAGRSDASGCNATQPNFAAAVAANNVSFRIPISTFGEGLVENIPEAALESNVAQSANASLGIAGTLNRSGNDGTITRFGWKAQNKSLTIFAMEAYNVEQGVTNAGFPDEREGGASNLQGCMSFNPTPEDNFAFEGDGDNSVSDTTSDVINFAFAMQLSKPPTQTLPPGVSQNTVVQGTNQFVNIGCANCHTQSFTTAASSFDSAMSNFLFHPYSDFAIHNMGTGLADGISQGNAGPQQFRTAPLWGVGQRLFFLHDGRTSDLAVAIAAHSSSGSEANAVITKFNNLSQSDQQAVLDFLRSL
jgi:CxxC motif-containing protein (DUF1111 family)